MRKILLLVFCFPSIIPAQEFNIGAGEYNLNNSYKCLSDLDRIIISNEIKEGRIQPRLTHGSDLKTALVDILNPINGYEQNLLTDYSTISLLDILDSIDSIQSLLEFFYSIMVFKIFLMIK